MVRRDMGPMSRVPVVASRLPGRTIPDRVKVGVGTLVCSRPRERVFSFGHTEHGTRS